MHRPQAGAPTRAVTVPSRSPSVRSPFLRGSVRSSSPRSRRSPRP